MGSARLIASLVMAGVQALAYLALPAFRLSPWLILGYVLFSLASSFASVNALTPLMDAIVGHTNPVEIRALAISLRNLIGMLAAGVGTPFVGWLYAVQGTFTWTTIILSAVALLSVLFLWPTLQPVLAEMADLSRAVECRSGTQGQVGSRELIS